MIADGREPSGRMSISCPGVSAFSWVVVLGLSAASDYSRGIGIIMLDLWCYFRINQEKLI